MMELQDLLRALSAVTDILLAVESGQNITPAVLESMEVIGRRADADRVQIWQNEIISGSLYFTRKYEWLSETGRPKPPVPAGERFSYGDIPDLENKFSRGKHINSPFPELQRDIRDFLDGYGIKSVAMIPLFVRQSFWGVFEVDDCLRERDFSDAEISLFQSAGLLIANSLSRGIGMTLSASEAFERFEMVWANVECGISLIDAETRQIIDINPVAERMFGGSKANIIGRRCHKVVCPAEECACPIIDKNQTVDRSERVLLKANGEKLPIIKSVAKIVLNGRLTLLESFTDISNLKDAEEKLRFMEVTEQANQAKTDFLSCMSHEMRTPMNAIIGMTAIGKSAHSIERKNYALGKIEDASTHLLGIINDILDMAKIEAGKFELSPVEFSFEKMLQRVVNVISFRVEEKKQKFSLYLDKAIPPVLFGDSQRMAQIITNLLGNAVKFTPAEGSVRLNAGLLEENDGVCTIRVEVIDSGIGISPEQQSRLFKSFQQAESSTARKFGGTGLGLSISKDIVEMMHGKIWVESELGNGASFIFTVQLARGDSEKYARTVRETNWKNIRVLTVDDDAGILGYVKNCVEGSGGRCDTAVCGKDALELVRRNGAYDIYFIDWKMPDIDGLNLTRALKMIEPDRNKIVVIMISSVEWNDIEERAKEAGVDKFLPKPLFPSVIIEVINDFLGVVQQQIDESAAERAVIFKKKRILLAEDVEINREIVLSLLEPTLLNIDCAENGVEAVRLFTENPNKYDAILMDVQMPELDGYEATREIRSLDLAKAKEIPIIAMTANVFREDIERCLEAGMNDHIGKPIDLNQVLDKLRTYL